MTARIEADLCVIGGGSGGLSVAAGAVQMGARTVLIERGRMGGDCLNTGCVPSKALLAAARAAQSARGSAAFGIAPHEPEIAFSRTLAHVREVIAGIAPHDSQERFEGLGVTVLRDHARFVGPDRVRAGTTEVRARRFVIATGSTAALPPLPGLESVPYLTNETLFEERPLPRHLLVLGGGPVGLEMAQAHRRLGSRVTLVEMARLLPNDDPELVAVLRAALTDEGIEIREGARTDSAARDGNAIALTLTAAQGVETLTGDALLVATGRRPVTDGLDLEAAGIAHDRSGIPVDARLRTSNRRVFAIGDVANGPRFTHWAGYQAGIVLRNALFRLPARAQPRLLPWVTYTDPELAQVGLTEPAARAAGHAPEVVSWPFAENDRARAERRTEGLVKAVLDRRGRVLGVGIVGAHAGELLAPWCLAVSQRLKIGAMAGLVLPYPTLGETSKRAAGSHFTPRLFSRTTRRLVRFLARFG